MVSKFASHWNKDGSVQASAPRWAALRSDMRNAFPTYYSTDSSDPFADMLHQAIRYLDQLKPPQPQLSASETPGYLGGDPSGPHYGNVTQTKLGDKMSSIADVLKQAADLFKGMPNWNHPLVMANVIPPANTAAIIAAMMTQVFSPNIIEGEYSWDIERTEMEASAILADLIGWPTQEAGGLFTFGGSGCYLYGIKYALTSCLGMDSRCSGIRTDAKVLVSQQGHYCKMNSTDWTGLGMENFIDIDTDDVTNAMDFSHLEQVMRSLHAEGTPIAAIVCTMGTTDAFAVDPIDKVRALVDELYPLSKHPDGIGRPLIYADAVIGWSWLTFKGYNFRVNPLNFTLKVLDDIQKNYDAISKIVHADAIGCDFHKTGWATYNCSVVMVRNLHKFQELLSRPGSAYLQARTCYNPGLYTLEVSRSGSYSMAAWATLKFFGYEGFRSILGGILEIQHYLRDQVIAKEPTVVCVNAADSGFVTLFRVYKKGVDAKVQYERELTEPAAREELKANNTLQQQIADMLWQWHRDGQLHEGGYAPYISYTSGFRPTNYADETEPEFIYAVKAFPMNVNITPEVMDELIRLVLVARDAIEAGQLPQPNDNAGNCPVPYSEFSTITPLECASDEAGAGGATSDNLLSGIGRQSLGALKRRSQRRSR
ncbi:pyridoxal phosphate-dependent decarboxylase family protein [Anabaena azotica]|uniref:Aspartate aminotransferase family protein n=1 Tax=Anabaena azotica FACHB-119 TaxID=947527 RepID=A0ABR8DFQ7_9NOST|nr:pyridoxal-dependent decarboxylase [Anabaena azotica]MBD2505363.1 aspartate aminotransferase family protein [Anabaena azotica FACHB-119]